MTSRSHERPDDRSDVLSLDQRRRARRAAAFFAELLAGGEMDEVASLRPPLPDLKHLPRVQMDIAATRDLAPAHTKSVIAFARRRQMGFILVRFRDPAPGLAEILGVDVLLVDGGGVAVLAKLQPATSDSRRWTLAGQHPGEVHLRVAPDGLVPTLTEPWTDEEDRVAFILKADRIFADYIWA